MDFYLNSIKNRMIGIQKIIKYCPDTNIINLIDILKNDKELWINDRYYKYFKDYLIRLKMDFDNKDLSEFYGNN